MLNKIRSFPSLLPNSIVATIPTYSPEHGSTHDDCEKWLKTYNTPTYRNSLFFKGLCYTLPQILLDIPILSELMLQTYSKTK